MIHDTAVVAPSARLGEGVSVGPFAVIEDDVDIGAGSVIGPHAVVRRYTRMGADNTVDAGAVIGGLPQHLAFDGSESWVIVGDRNTFREGVTINRAHEPGAATTVGSQCFFMTSAHVGHDCRVSDRVILTNGAVLGGHASVGRNAVLGGYAAVHQFVNVGAFCMVAACTALRKDALPFTMIGGNPVRHYRLNAVGLRRNGITGERYRVLERAFRALREGDREFTDLPQSEETRALRAAWENRSKYGCYGFAGSAASRRPA